MIKKIIFALLFLCSTAQAEILQYSPVPVSGSGTVNTGTAGQAAYYAANGTTISGTSFLDISATGYIGINNSSPTYPVDVTGVAVSGPYGQVTQRLTSSGSETGLLMANSATGGKQFEFLSTSNASGLGGGKFAIADADSSASRLTITATGTIGIGTGAPVSPLSIVAPGGTANSVNAGAVLDLTGSNGSYAEEDISAYGNASGSQILLRSATGTSAAPVAVTAGTRLGNYGWTGYTSAGSFGGQTAAIGGYAAENFTATSQGSYLLFGTTATGSTTRVTNVAISPAGYLGIGTSAPSATLQVNGSMVGGNIDTQTASYTAVLSDAGGFVPMNCSSACNFTIPPNSSVAYPVSTTLCGSQAGAGAVTLVAGSGVTLQPATTVTTSQYSTFCAIQTTANTWTVMANNSQPVIPVVWPSGWTGTFTCTAAGTITIANANFSAASKVIISMNTAGGTITTPPAMKTVTAGTGFTVLCGATDTSIYNYGIMN